MDNIGKKFTNLIEIMKRLRGPNGCPWDKEQTMQSASPYMLEETYETLEAIDKGDPKEIREELGDLLLQIVFQSQIASDEKITNIEEVIDSISEKLIRRHPHIFGDEKVDGTWGVLQNWEKIKRQEGKKTILGGVPKALPALLKTYRLGQKAGRVGFDWPDAEGVLNKVEEEARELHEANKTKDKSQIEHEYGDLLMTLASLGRFLKVDPETALRKATDRFISRFSWMEEEIKKAGLDIHNISFEKWEELWNSAKKNL